MSDRQPDPAATAHRKRLVMVMGVQRSGTTAVLEKLSRSPGVTARNESIDDPLYHEYYLRPEPEIRGVLHSLPGTVLLKPEARRSLKSARPSQPKERQKRITVGWLTWA